MNPAELRELIHDKGFRGEYLASIRHRGKDVLLGDIEKLLEIMIDEYVEIEERKAENATLNQQLSAHQLSQQNIINAFGIKGEGAHSKLVIEYVHGLAAGADKSLNENLRLKEKIHANELYIRALEVERKAFEKSSETIHKLVAENSALLKFIKDDCFVYTSDIGEPSDANDFKPETPVSEAVISDIKAQGVDDLVARRTAAARIAMEHNDKANFLALSDEAARAAMFAANLRSGRKG